MHSTHSIALEVSPAARRELARGAVVGSTALPLASLRHFASPGPLPMPRSGPSLEAAAWCPEARSASDGAAMARRPHGDGVAPAASLACCVLGKRHPVSCGVPQPAISQRRASATNPPPRPPRACRCGARRGVGWLSAAAAAAASAGSAARSAAVGQQPGPAAGAAAAAAAPARCHLQAAAAARAEDSPRWLPKEPPWGAATT